MLICPLSYHEIILFPNSTSKGQKGNRKEIPLAQDDFQIEFLNAGDFRCTLIGLQPQNKT